MFTISPRDRALYQSPVGLETTAMIYGRLAHRPEPSKLTAHRRPITPWSRDATWPTDSLPLVREVTRRPTTRVTRKPAPVSERVSCMLRALSIPKVRH